VGCTTTAIQCAAVEPETSERKTSGTGSRTSQTGIKKREVLETAALQSACKPKPRVSPSQALGLGITQALGTIRRCVLEVPR
jgi:hypothetical protein